MKQIGESVRAVRRTRGWTQAQLARALGTDAVTVSRWERGVSRPRPSALGRLAALGMSPGPSGGPRFAEEPALRIRRLDAAVREQVRLKQRARRIG